MQSSIRKLPYHYSKLRRKETVEKRRKLRKLEWFKKMYQLGKNLGDKEEKWLNLKKGLDVAKSDFGEPDGEEIDQMIKDLDMMELDQSLLSWPKALDFDAYHQEWLSLAATAPSNNGNLSGWSNPNILDYKYAVDKLTAFYELSQEEFDDEEENKDGEEQNATTNGEDLDLFITKVPT